MQDMLARRGFLAASMAGGLATLSGSRLVAGITPVSDQQVQEVSGRVQLLPEIEPLVRLIEDTPRERLLEEVGSRVRDGLSYTDVLAALFLAGVRNVQPRPAVGFKFHAVLVVNSAHAASMSSPHADRWLPIFWALDEFKSSQARDVSEGNWTMAPVDEAQVPTPEKVRAAFHTAMQNWDEAAADAASAGVARWLGATDMLELFAQYAARDFRSIGHKAIYLANSWRTLQTIGWQHAEPVQRSLAYALLNHNGEPNPASSDLAPDRPWKQNSELAGRIRANWQQGQVDHAATAGFLSVLRSDSADSAAQAAVELLNRGVAPQSLFDALHLAAGELLMRQSGIVALHAVTTTNALHFLFDHTSTEDTRKRLLLQNVSFLPLFREAMRARGAVADVQIDQLQAAPAAGDQTAAAQVAAVEAIFQSVGSRRAQAAQDTLNYLASGRDPAELMHAARRLIFLKGNDSHDYKFSTAVLEDYYRISPHWRQHFLASGTYSLRGASDPDNGLVARIRAALA